MLLLALLVSGCQPSFVAQPTPNDITPSQFVEEPASERSPTLNATLQTDGKDPLENLDIYSADNIARLTLLAQIGEGTFGDQFAVSPDGTLLAVATAGGALIVDAASGERSSFHPSQNAIDDLVFSPDGNYLATVQREPGEEIMTAGDTAGMPIFHPVLSVRDLSSNEPLFTLNLAGRGCGEYAATGLAYSPDGKMLVFRDYYSWIGHDRADNLCFVSAENGNLVQTIPVELPWETTAPALFSSDGRWLFVAVVNRDTEGDAEPATRIRVYDVNTGSLAREFDGLGIIFDMSLSPDGKRLALADRQGARLLSADDGRLEMKVGNHAREVMAVAFSPDGATLALGSIDGTASLWDVTAGTRRWTTSAWKPVSPNRGGSDTAEIWNLAFSPDGNLLFVLAPSHVIEISGRIEALRVSDGQELNCVYDHNNSSQPAFSPDGDRLVIGGYEDGRVQVWSAARNQLLFNLEGHTGMVLADRFSPDGRQIATASMDGSVRLWNSEDGSPVATLSGHSGPVRVVQYSPDGKWLASAGKDATLRIWDATSGDLHQTIPTQTGDWLVNEIAFSKDGSSVILGYHCDYSKSCPAIGGGDLRRVNLENGQIETLISYAIDNLSFASDQMSFAIEGGQGPQSGRITEEQFQVQTTYTSPMGNGALVGAAISPDGTLFFSGNGFGLHVWRASNAEMLALCRGATNPYGVIWSTGDQKMILIAQTNGLVSIWGVLAENG